MQQEVPIMTLKGHNVQYNHALSCNVKKSLLSLEDPH